MPRKDCNLQPVCEICNTSVLHLRYKNRNKFPKTCSRECKGLLISKSIAPGIFESAAKSAETKRRVLPSGETVAQAAARKANLTMLKNGTRKVSAKKRLEKMAFDEEFSNKIRQGMSRVGEDGLTAAQRGGRAARQTLINKGVFVDPAKLSEWQKYSRRVRYLTSKQNLHLLENIDRRGAVQHGGWHLDHVISVKEGFDRGLKPEAVAALENLRMVPALDNIKKGSRSG